MCCGFKCCKYLLFIFNFIFWVAGAALLAVGIWFLADQNALKLLNVNVVSTGDTLVRAAAIAVVIVGALMFIIGGLGCFGACTENSTCLIIFATLLFVLLAGQVAAGVLAGVYRQKMMNELQAVMTNTVQTTYANGPDVRAAWDYVQVELKCCGVRNATDWQTSAWFTNMGRNSSQTVPLSCCVLNNTDVFNPIPVNAPQCMVSALLPPSDPNRSKYINTPGCYDSMSQWISLRIVIIIAVAIGLVVVQLIGIIMACCLGNSLRNKNVYK